MPVAIANRVELCALPGLPVIEPGDDLAKILWDGLQRAGITLAHGDVVVVASKLLSRAEGRFVDVSRVEPSARAIELAATVAMDPRLVELILGESVAVSRVAPQVLIVRHRLGFVSANAAIDLSNAQPAGIEPGTGPWALLIPTAPDASAAALRSALETRAGVTLGVIITDSLGRPFRVGTVGAAIGVAGIPALNDQRGSLDMHGRVLEHTITALADQIAAAADLVAGQANERRGAVHVRGVVWDAASQDLWGKSQSEELLRSPDQDLYA